MPTKVKVTNSNPKGGRAVRFFFRERMVNEDSQIRDTANNVILAGESRSLTIRGESTIIIQEDQG